MTKGFLRLQGRAMTYSSRRFPQRPFTNVAYKTDAEIETERTDLLKKIHDQVETQLGTRVKKEDVDKEIKLFTDQFKDVSIEGLRAMTNEKTGVMAILKAQGDQINELKENGGQRGKKDLSIRGQIVAWMESTEKGETLSVRQRLEKIKEGEKMSLPPLNLRVASPMTPANSLNSSAYLPMPEMEAGINDIVRVQPTFWDYLTKGRTSKSAYVWVNKRNPLGAAGFIGPGVAKPGVSFEVETQISNAKKVAVNEKIATELLDDIDGFASWVEGELRYQLMIKVSTTLMTGVLSSTVPAGIQTLSTTFTATGIVTTNPNNFDAVRACVAQLRNGNLVGAITVFINPIDAANMDLSKAISSGVYLLPPFTDQTGKVIGGAIVVEDNNIAIGYMQVAILQYYKILMYQDFVITYGWENDDFTKNLITVLGEMRFHQIFSENYTGAFIYDTFANVKTAITAP